MARLKFDTLDRQILHALDASFIIDNETATLSGPLTIRIERVGDDRLEMVIGFAELEFPVLMSRSQTLKQLNIKADDA